METYSSSPHLYEELDIPEGTKGRLPRDKRVLAGVDAEVLEDLGETGKKNTRPSGGRDSGRDSNRDAGRSGARDSSSRRTSEPGGRSGDRRRRTSDAATAGTSPAPEPAAAAPAEGEVDPVPAAAGPAPAAATVKWWPVPATARSSAAPRHNSLDD
ncbi:atp-Dependent RNA helicase [Arthrobacter sp. Hiyo4]|nr:atp-Dependent RNA helicase [Arthrobacter sp. Hiyo4]